MTTVLITTSGTGSRLGSITNHTNKSLVPVGDKLALSRIIELYPAHTDFIITIGYKGELVKEYCSLAHPERKIEFVSVDCFEGPGSSLLYSMLQASHLLQKPFIFHCCDTILETLPSFINQNTLLVAKHPDFSSYSSISVVMNTIQEIHSKGFLKNDFCYIGLAHIEDYDFFWAEAQSLYEENQNDSSLNDIRVFQAMLSKSIHFTYKVCQEFYDTGNLDSYKKCQDHFSSSYDILVKPNESLSFLEKGVIKFNSNPFINQKRLERCITLSPYTPKILGSTKHFILMEYIEGEVLSNSKSYGDILQLLEWAQKNLWSKQNQDQKYIQDCYDFYFLKTKERISKLILEEPEYIYVNDLYTQTALELLESIPQDLLATQNFTHFHGDFILDNIIKRPNGTFCLLDWREDFNKNLEFGDMYYDLAKLKHNIIFNHKNITNGLFSVEKKEGKIYVDLKCNYILIKQLEEFQKFLQINKYNEKKVNLLTAIIWINMAPLYPHPLQTFLFYFGKLNLALALRENT